MTASTTQELHHYLLLGGSLIILSYTCVKI